MSEGTKKPPVLENKKSRRNYEVLETLEAGISLMGSEVKSLRLGKAEFADAYAVTANGEMTLINLRIEPYQSAGPYGHEEKRTRKLLLHKKEIVKLTSKIREKRLTVIPLKLYFNDKGRVKVLLGVARGKKTEDKRQDEKKAQAKTEIDRAMRRNSSGK